MWKYGVFVKVISKYTRESLSDVFGHYVCFCTSDANYGIDIPLQAYLR